MLFPLNRDALLTFLRQHQFDPKIQEETDVIYITPQVEKNEIPIFFAIKNEGELLQSFAYLPFKIEEKNLAQMARLLHVLNRNFDMPGFGMDEETRLVFYRSVIPALDGQVEGRMVSAYLKTALLACSTFVTVIDSFSAGLVKIEDFLHPKS